MKNLIAVFVVIATMFASCTKQASKELASEKMNGVEFTKKYGIELPYLDYTTSNIVARGKKQKAEAVTFSVLADLQLTESGSVLTTTISPDAEWGGVQRFVDMTTNDGAVSVCNWNWSYTQAPATMNCNSNGTGIYRGWTSDHNYDVHLSNLLPL